MRNQRGDGPDGVENGESKDSPPASIGFWDHRLKHVRHEVGRKWLYTTVVLMIFILSVLSICKSPIRNPYRLP